MGKKRIIIMASYVVTMICLVLVYTIFINKKESIVEQQSDIIVSKNNDDINLGDGITGCASQQGNNCNKCQSGYYLSGNRCIICPAGYSCGGTTNKIKCPAGTYSGAGSAICTPCSAGTKQDEEGKSICVSCFEGRYQNLTGQTSCKICEAGSYTDSRGASGCTQCEAGYYCPGNVTKTGYNKGTKVACPIGTYGEGVGQTAESACNICGEGTYTGVAGQDSCSVCPKGYSCPGAADIEGYTKGTAVACAPGTHQNETGKSSCKTCIKGKYQDEAGQERCKACTKGNKCPTTGMTSPTSCRGEYHGYQDDTGQEECKHCFGTVAEGYTGCTTCTISSIDVSQGTGENKVFVKSLSVGEEYTVTVNTEGCKDAGNNYAISLSGYPGTIKSGKTDYGVFNISIPANYTGETCKDYTITATITDDTFNNSELYPDVTTYQTSKSKKAHLSKAWSTETNMGVYTQVLPTSASEANKQGMDIYAESCENDELRQHDGAMLNDGNTYYLCKKVHKRECNDINAVPTKRFCCMDREFIGSSNHTSWQTYRLYEDCPDFAANGWRQYVTYYDADGTELVRDTCMKYDSGANDVCDKNNTTFEDESTLEMEKCEGSISKTLSNVKNECGEGTESFYEITCQRKVKTNFDYGGNNSVDDIKMLYVGEGFGFDINVETEVTCNATFNVDNWNKIFNKFITKIRHIDPMVEKNGKYEYSELEKAARARNGKDRWEARVKELLKITTDPDAFKQSASELYELYNDIGKIRNVVEVYNSFDPNSDNDFDESATLNFDYNIKNDSNTKNDSYIFEKTVDDSSGAFTITKSDDTIESLDDNIYFKSANDNACYSDATKIEKLIKDCMPINYTISNSSNKRKVKLLPSQASLSMYDGSLVKPTEDYVPVIINGGNKIYTNYKIEEGEWDLSISVTGLAGNLSIENNQCSITTKDTTTQYRRIDVSNPFINISWEKGQNWLNNIFSFVDVINSATWVNPNGTNNSPLGTFDISSNDISDLQSSNARNTNSYLGICDLVKSESQDSITKAICTKLNDFCTSSGKC